MEGQKGMEMLSLLLDLGTAFFSFIIYN